MPFWFSADIVLLYMTGLNPGTVYWLSWSCNILLSSNQGSGESPPNFYRDPTCTIKKGWVQTSELIYAFYNNIGNTGMLLTMTISWLTESVHFFILENNCEFPLRRWAWWMMAKSLTVASTRPAQWKWKQSQESSLIRNLSVCRSKVIGWNHMTMIQVALLSGVVKMKKVEYSGMIFAKFSLVTVFKDVQTPYEVEIVL